MRINGVDVHVGTFDDERAAALARDRVVRESGAALRLNFPDPVPPNPPSRSLVRAERRAQLKMSVRSRFRGVTWHAATQRWTARIQHENTTHHLGLFDDEHAASEAYHEAARRLRGDDEQDGSGA